MLTGLRGAAALAVLALAACNTFSKGAELSYGQVQTIQPGLTATQILDSFGEPGRKEFHPNGQVAVLDYAALDAKTNHARLVLGFDDRGVLREKRYTGAVLKP